MDAPAVTIAPDAAPPLPPRRHVEVPPARPQAKGKRHALKLDKPLKLPGNRTITWTSSGHGRMIVGGDRALHQASVAKGADHDRLSVTSEYGGAEADVFGTAVVFVAGWRQLDVIVVGRTPKPIDESKIIALIEKRAAAVGLPVGRSSGGARDGLWIYTALDEYGRSLWHAVFGLYSRRLWFQPVTAWELHPCYENPLAKGCS